MESTNTDQANTIAATLAGVSLGTSHRERVNLQQEGYSLDLARREAEKAEAAKASSVARAEAERLALLTPTQRQAENQAVRDNYLARLQAKKEAEAAADRRAEDARIDALVATYKPGARARWLLDNPDKRSSDFDAEGWPHARHLLAEELGPKETEAYAAKVKARNHLDI